MASKNGIYNHLHSKTVGDLVDMGALTGIVSVRPEDTVETLVRVMSTAGISSVPVVGATGGALGYVDSLDVVSFIVAAAPQGQELRGEHLARMEMFGRVVHLEPVSEILNFSGRDPYVPVDLAAPLTMPLALFATGIHRVPVVNHEGAMIDSLSQSRINSMLCKDGLIRRGHLGEMSGKTLAALGLAECTIVSVREHETVVSALHKMRKSAVSALAVVGENGRLCGNLSATSLRNLSQERLPNLLRSVSEFLAEHAPDSTTPIVVRADSTLADAMTSMAENKIHRVWVVDGDFAPVGVVSLTDVMRTIAHNHDGL